MAEARLIARRFAEPDPRIYWPDFLISAATSSGIQAAAYSHGGEVFLLDMGRPIRIVDMARRFIRIQGLQPDADVPIVFTGPRPGEKLFEELAYDGEDMLPTPHRSIRP